MKSLILEIFITAIVLAGLLALLSTKFWLFVKSYWIRLSAAGAACFVIVTYPYLDEYLNKMYKLQPDSQIYFNGIVLSVIQNAVFAMFLFSIFSGTIDRWLGHDVTESSKFDPKRFLKGIRESSDDVIIQETFIRVLVQDHKHELVEALKKFFDNHVKKYPNASKYEGKVRILVLHPFGSAIRIRQSELGNHIEKDKKKFLVLTRDLLNDLKDIQGEVNKYALDRRPNKTGYFFEIRISYRKPMFSLYHCDQYASVSYYTNEPCENAPQLIFDRNTKRINPAAEKHLEFFESNWNWGILLTNTYFKLAFSRVVDPENFKSVVSDFRKITKSNIEADIILKLKSISDLCTNNAAFALELINYVEIHHRKTNINHVDMKKEGHFNIVGTGGDDKDNRTINISTIVSILASHLKNIDSHTINIPIIKLGTLAVTGKIGSQTFYETLQSKIYPGNNISESNYNLIPLNKQIFADYNVENGSTYVPIIYFGYMYRQVLRNARKEFIKQYERHVDIFKVIFPLANLTIYEASINGVSRDEYLNLYEQIYKLKQKTGIVLRNDRDIDELFHGNNTIIYYKNGEEVYKYTKKIKVKNLTIYNKFFKECDDQDHGATHVEKFFELLINKPDLQEDIKTTICYNIALFVQLHFLLNDDYPTNEKRKAEDAFGESRLDNLMSQIKELFFKTESIC